MVWGYHHLRKHPSIHHKVQSFTHRRVEACNHRKARICTCFWCSWGDWLSFGSRFLVSKLTCRLLGPNTSSNDRKCGAVDFHPSPFGSLTHLFGKVLSQFFGCLILQAVFFLFLWGGPTVEGRSPKAKKKKAWGWIFGIPPIFSWHPFAC